MDEMVGLWHQGMIGEIKGLTTYLQLELDLPIQEATGIAVRMVMTSAITSSIEDVAEAIRGIADSLGVDLPLGETDSGKPYLRVADIFR